MRNLCAVLIALALFFTPQALALEPLDADGLSDTLAGLLDTHDTAKRTNIALKVVDLETGDVLFDRNSDKLLTPASNLKIYTSAAALALLGPEYTWETRIGLKAWDQARDKESDVFVGYVALLCDGDPMFDTEQMRAMIGDFIAHVDQTELSGGILTVGTQAWTDVPPKGPGWMWDDDPYYYNMTIGASMLNFNVMSVSASPGSDIDAPVVLEYDPPLAPGAFPIDSFSRSMSKNKAVTSSPDEDSTFVMGRDPFEDHIWAEGALPLGSKPVKERVSVFRPRYWISRAFEAMLEESSVVYQGAMSYEEHDFDPLDPSAYEVVVEHQGKTLAEAIKHFLKVSENAVGEMVLLKLAETFGEDNEVSWPSGAKVISDWLVNEAGLEAGSFRLVDGSGLSRYNLISADSSIRLLAYMKTHEHYEPFFDGLPVYKVALPEAGSFNGVPLAEFDAERVFAKPGGMSGVSTISGYAQTLDGRWLAFSYLANGYIGSNAPIRDLRTKIWAELVRYQPAEVEAVAE